MRFTGPAAPNMFDLHVLRGQSVPELSGRLEVRDQDDDEWKSFDVYRVDNDDVQIEFRPVFNAANHTAEYEGFGIRVTKETGEIDVAIGAIADQPHNFILGAVVLRNTGGDPIKRRTVRIHLHDSVEKIW